MKYKFELNSITIGEVKVEGVILDAEVSLEEMRGMVSLMKEVVEYLPKATDVIMDVAEKVVDRMIAIDKKVVADDKEVYEVEIPEELLKAQADREHELNLKKYRCEEEASE